MISEGRSVSSRAASIARATAPMSLPSARCTCQPYASKRSPTCSLNAISVLPSIEMSLSS
jgi:hypothetical protein